MATNTNGGTTTSLDNTPQAKDDYYTAGEDQVLYFAVMANDLGGNAKVLWSVDNTSDDGSGDLVARDVAGVCEYSELGAKISLTSDGRIKYDTTLLDGLAAGQTFTDQFTYAIRMSNGTLSWATVTVTLTGTNDGPVAVADVASGNEDSTISGSVATNDSDVDNGAVLSFAVSGTAPAGFVMDEDGNWTLDASDAAYQHIAQGASEDVVVSYTVTDEHGASATTTLTVTVHGANDAPVAASDTAAVDEDELISGSVAGNDGDVDDGATLTYALVDAAPDGLTFGDDGSWSFDASSYDSLAQGEELVLTIPYTVTDEHGASDGSTLTITVTGTNDGPVANADLGTAGENDVLTIDVLGNDTDADNGAVLTVTAASAPAGQGTASVVANQVQFDPGTDFDHLAEGASATVVVSYSIEDEHGASSSSTLTITVTGTNDGPVANVDSAGGHENETLLIDVLGNDEDVDDGASLTVTSASAPAGQGTASVMSNQVQFDPGTDFDHLAEGATATVTVDYTIQDEHGAASSSTVTITVTGTNDAPVAVADAVAVDEDAGLTGSVATNDSDVDDGAVLTYALVDPAPEGLTFGADGGWSFDASSYDGLAEGQTLVLTIPYTVTDEHLASDDAALTITITGTNDGPVANADLGSGHENEVLLVDVLANDTDADDGAVLTVTGASAPSGQGTASVVGNQVQFDPGADFDHLAEGESTQVVVSYSIADEHGALSNSTVTITVTGTNDAPIAVADLATTDEDNSVLINVLANDDDPDTTDTLTITAASVTNGLGSVAIESGQLLYDPGSDYDYLADGENAEVTLSYTIDDGSGGAATASVTVTVSGVNDAPVAVGVADSTDENTVYNGSVTGSDIDGDALTYALAPGETLPHGVTFNADGTFSVAPLASDQSLDDGEERVVSFMVVANDGTVNSAPEAVTITINGVNDAPELTGAPAPLASGTEDNSYTVTQAQLLQGWTDVDVESLTATGLTASNGTVTQNPDGSYTITPTANYNGPVTLNYFVSDGTAAVAASLGYTLAPVNDAAVISGMTSGTVVEATPANPGTPTATGTLLAADVDNPPNTFIAAASTPTASGYGSFTMTAGGVWTYTLDNANATVNALATGTLVNDTFTVQSADGTSQTITVTINGATDAIVVTPPPTFNGTGDPNDFDTLAGGTLVGGGFTGSNSAETITGGAANQTFNMNGGNDTAYGAGGGDVITGGEGNDNLYGQGGNDQLFGQGGNDELYGGSGNDLLEGGDNNDLDLYGGSGTDTIVGGNNTDRLYGGFGDDTLTGGAGADDFIFLDLRDTNDTILDFMNGNDQIDVSALDANGSLAGNQAFSWGGATATANGLWMVESGGNTTIFGDTDGNAATAEFMLTLQGFTAFDPLLPPPTDITF